MLDFSHLKAPPAPSAAFPADYRRLRTRLARIGWVALGSLLERNQPGQGGPRYQWSRRVEGKTVTVALSAQQFAWLKNAIANQRAVQEILAQMHILTLQEMWKQLPETKRRKRLSKKTMGLN
jgi:3',5'-cyclic AMP phosphodiesterase CpdA